MKEECCDTGEKKEVNVSLQQALNLSFVRSTHENN